MDFAASLRAGPTTGTCLSPCMNAIERWAPEGTKTHNSSRSERFLGLVLRHEAESTRAFATDLFLLVRAARSSAERHALAHTRTLARVAAERGEGNWSCGRERTYRCASMIYPLFPNQSL